MNDFVLPSETADSRRTGVANSASGGLSHLTGSPVGTKPVNEMTGIEAARELRRLLATVPPTYQGWGYEKTKEFKSVAAKACRLVESTASVGSLRAALVAMRAYW